ncbi:MAG: site-specific DNA-methyltransferase [Chloroflexota bacterium]|nr:site-specific DNA-methyltransferase [Chloroflexota bacterium]
MSFNTKLINLLKTNPNLVDDNGELLIVAVQDRAWKIDHDLIKLLLSDEEIKAKFFDEIEGHWIFNINTFLEYITEKNFLDNSYSRFRNRIGLTIDGKYLKERGEVSLVWRYKDCVLEGGQTKEEEKRKEIFFNKILAQDEINRMFDPKVLTNFTRFTTTGKQPVKEIKRDENGLVRENLLIRGNNLLALHSIKQQFHGRVKLIYIDPPYNTGNDTFRYNDNFNHSTWLTFMKNRLEVAKELLSRDGSIIIQIDNNEQAYLKVLCDEIFNRENFVNQIAWLRSSSGKTISRNLPNDVDYLLWYSCSPDYMFNPVYKPLSESTKKMYNKNDNDGRGDYRLYPLQKTGGPGPETTYDYVDNNGNVWECPVKGWRMKQEKLKALENDNRLYISDTTIAEKAYWDEREHEGRLANNLWDDIYNLQGSNKELLDFSGQKPEKLLSRIIKMTTQKGDIVCDFQLGTGTTCSVAHKMNRQYIGVEQLYYPNADFLNRLNNVINGDNSGISKSVNWIGGGDFLYCELLKYNQLFIERIQDAENSEQLLQIWHGMAENSFLNWYVNPEMPQEAVKDFIAIGQEENGLEKQKKLLAELLDKNQLYVNLSEINDEQFNVSDEDKDLNKAFYGEI